MSNIVLKLAKRPEQDAGEIPHRVPYQQRPTPDAGNMPGPVKPQKITRDM